MSDDRFLEPTRKCAGIRYHTLRYCLFLFVLLWGRSAFAVYLFDDTVPFVWDTSATTDVVWEQVDTDFPIDDDKELVNIGFTFVLGGAAYTQVRILSNGALHFGANQGFHKDYTNEALPITGVIDGPGFEEPADRVILPYWDDLEPSQGGTVRYGVAGSAPNRRFVVTWENLPHYPNVGAYTVQAILFENGTFKFQYGPGDANGSSATIGVEVDNSDFTQYSFNNDGAVGNGSAILFFEPPPPPVLAYYPMEEPAWSGAAGEVTDASGNGNDGTAVGNAQTSAQGYLCRGAEIPFNTSHAVRDAVNTGVDVDDDIGNRGTISFWYRSNANWSGGGDRLLFDASTRVFNNNNDKYFALVLLNSGVLRFALEDSSDTDFQALTGANTFAADEWVHVAVTWDLPADRMVIFVNGTQAGQMTSNTSGSLGDVGPLYIGDSSSSYFGVGNSANGVIDEMRIYAEVQTAAQIQTDMAVAGSCLVAYWRMEQAGWDGTPGELLDSSGNGLHGTSVAGATTAATAPAIVGDPGTCRYGQFDGTNDYAEVPDGPLLDIPGELTAMAWIKAGAIPAGGLKTIVSKDENYEFHLDAAGQIYWWWQDPGGTAHTLTTTGAPIAPGAWYHIAVVYSSSAARQTIYINAVPRASSTLGSNLMQNNDPLQIGADQGFGGRQFDGNIDEVRVYSSALSQADVAAAMTETHPCPAPAIDHFVIDVGAGTASTCLPLSVTITAADAANSPVPDYTGTVAITTSSNHGNWSVNTAANPTLPNPDNDDDGAVGYTFALADNGSIILDLSNVHADDLTITVNDASAGVSSTSALVQFRDNLFVIAPTTCTGSSCPGTGSTEVVAGRDHGFHVEFWRRDAPESGTCGIETRYAGNQNLKVWRTDDGDHPAGAAAPTVGATTLTTAVPGANNLALDFTAGEADFALSSTDVGKYALNLRDDTSGFAVDELGNPRPIDGSSATLTVRPFAIGIVDVRVGATANPGVDVPGGAIFLAAGADFEATARGVRWQGADDAGNDGVPNTGADLSDNAVTGAYAWNTILNSGDLSPPYSDLAFQPATGTRGTLTRGAVSPVTLAPGEFAAGAAAPVNLQYSEVGSFTMGAEVSAFLNTAGVAVVGWSGVIGRFTPADFGLALNTPQLDTQCDSGSGFTYLGQLFGYTTEPEVVATALNALGGTTLNYTEGGGWFKLTATKLESDGNRQYLTASGTLDLAGMTPPEFAVTNLGNGQGRVTVSSGAGLAYLRGASPAAPFDAEISLQFDVIDEDNVASSSNAASFASATPGNGIAFDTGKAMRWGRVTLANALGSELMDLPVPLAIEYWEDVGVTPGTDFSFVTHSDDSCTTLVAGDFTLPPASHSGNLDVGETAVTGVSLVSGTGAVTLSAPGATNDGGVDVVGNVPGYLEFDWDGDGNHDNDPGARATFGIYSGPPRRIYLREVY